MSGVVAVTSYVLYVPSSTSKWYCLYLLNLDTDLCTQVTFDELPGDLPFVDHCPNPESVVELCKENGWHLTQTTYEMIVGRWATEVTREYSVL